jgi:hypothetical protein
MNRLLWRFFSTAWPWGCIVIMLVLLALLNIVATP